MLLLPAHPQTPPMPAMEEGEASRWDTYKKRYPEVLAPYKLTHKSLVHKSIWVEEWSAESPARLKGWSLFFEANKHLVTEEIHSLETPPPSSRRAKPPNWQLGSGRYTGP